MLPISSTSARWLVLSTRAFAVPDRDERVPDGLPHGVSLRLRHTPEVPHFLPEVLRLLLQAPQLVVHLRRERQVPVDVLAGHQRGWLRRRSRLVPVPFCKRSFDTRESVAFA